MVWCPKSRFSWIKISDVRINLPCHDNENGLKGAAVALFVFTLNSLYRAVMGLECQEIRV